MRHILASLIFLIFAAPLFAQVEFEANSMFSAQVVSGGNGLVFTWEIFPELEDVFLDGSASGFADASDEAPPRSLAVGELFGLFADSNGTASDGGLSDALATTAGLLTVENTSLAVQDFQIALDWSIFADTSALDLFFDTALSDASISVLLDFDTILLDEFVLSDSVFNQGRSELGDVLAIGLQLPPGQTLELDFLTSSGGLASNFNSVPEPSGFVFAILLFAAAAFRRYRPALAVS